MESWNFLSSSKAVSRPVRWLLLLQLRKKTTLDLSRLHLYLLFFFATFIIVGLVAERLARVTSFWGAPLASLASEGPHWEQSPASSGDTEEDDVAREANPKRDDVFLPSVLFLLPILSEALLWSKERGYDHSAPLLSSLGARSPPILLFIFS
jgi:hypothetical protein